MRPVNLMPAEDRRGENPQMRTGGLVYIVIAALVAALAGVAALVLTGNQIADRESEISRLKVEQAAAQATSERLAAYTQFRQLREQRALTVSSLADSRFDWERVIRELSLILPADVWLTNLTGTAGPAVQVEGGSGLTTRQSVSGPALELLGCAAGQESVARFVTALHEIDGVTRVGVSDSNLPSVDSSGGSSAAGTPNTALDCRTRNFIAKFEIVVAFDAAPVSPSAGGVTTTGTVPAATPPAATAPADSATSQPTASTSTPTGG
jgi:Tfp pilus assembly protein PilN